MMRSSGPGGEYFEDLVEAIFSAPTKEDSMAIINSYTNYWTEIIGTRGFKGKKAINGNAMFDQLFTYEDDADIVTESLSEEEFDESKLDALGNE